MAQEKLAKSLHELFESYEKQRKLNGSASNPEIKRLNTQVLDPLKVLCSEHIEHSKLKIRTGKGSMAKSKKQVFYFLHPEETNTGRQGLYAALVCSLDPEDQTTYGRIALTITHGYEREKELNPHGYETSLQQRSEALSKVLGQRLVHKNDFKDRESGTFQEVGRVVNKTFNIFDTINPASLADDIKSLVETYVRHIESKLKGTVEDYRNDLELEISQSRKGDRKARLKRLAQAETTSKVEYRIEKVFTRNPDVVAEALFLAQDTCGSCEKPAPFKRRKDGTAYLEVHHLTPLSQGGEDSVKNTIALCPNCHRKTHHG